MKKLSDYFDVYSRRGNRTNPFVYNLPSTFRNRVLLLCRDTFSNKDNPCSSGNYMAAFWDEIHQMLTYRHGRPQLTLLSPVINSATDAASFLISCEDEEFLDFVEYIFKVKCLFHVTSDKNGLVAQFNQLFAFDGLGYELTNFIEEERPGRLVWRDCNIHGCLAANIKKGRPSHSRNSNKTGPTSS